MRASRLLSILMTLQAKGRVSAASLADEQGVSVRTIYRDLDELSATGVPVIAERGVNGGFTLLDGWRTRLTGMTSLEAKALFLVGLPGPARELGLGEAMASAQLKLLAALPADWQADAQRVGGRFHLDPVGWYREVVRADHLATLAEAVWGERRLSIEYQSWTKRSRKLVDPLGLVLKGGEWYLVARTERPEPSTFRVSNVLAAQVTEARFTRPRRFDLVAYWAGFVERFEGELAHERAVLRFTRGGLERALATGSPLARAVRAAHATPGAKVSVAYESIAFVVPELLRLGAEVEVLEPPALRAELTRAARALHRLYC